MQDASVLWPVHGLLHFLSRPKLWPKALLANLGAWAATLFAAVAVCWFTWPAFPPEQSWWWDLALVGLALGWGMLTFIFSWMVVVPILLSLAYEGLARRILIENGHQVVEESAIGGARSAVVFVLMTLHWRLGWLLLGLLPLLIGFAPLTWLIATVGLGHVALLDACDAAMAMRGRKGGERAKLIAEHRGELLAAGFTAGLAGHMLGTTIIGWLFWMPGLYVAAARRCPAWCLDEPCEEAAVDNTSEAIGNTEGPAA